jgi:outer membrane protein insertion porin family
MKYLFSLALLILTQVGAYAQLSDSTRSNNQILGGSVSLNYSNPKEYEIGNIRIEGADYFDHQAIKVIAGIRPGSRIKIPGLQITEAVKNLWKEGLFSTIDIGMDKEIGDVAFLVIKLTPRPKLSRFKFEGVSKKEADKLRESIHLFSGKTITENLVLTTKLKVHGFYREKGYYNVKVVIVREADKLMNNSEMFIIQVDKGKKVKIGNIEIIGNTTISSRKVKKAMKETKEQSIWRFYKRSKFSVSSFEKDKAAVLTKFQSIGLRDAHIVKDSVYLIDEKHLGIKIELEEGSIYRFGDIEWVGNTKFSSGFLDTILGIKNGDIYNKSIIDGRMSMSQDGRDISSLYMDRGYLFFQVIPIETGVKDHKISYQMRIIEGKEARVRKIIIKGNTKTNDHVIRREIRTKPGDLFNRNDIIRTQRELSQLGYFNNEAFQINPLPNPQEGTVDIEYTVEEKPSDQIELSGGYGAGRLIGTAGLTISNFSLRNAIKKSAWSPLPTGDGQRVSLRFQTNGTYYKSFNLSFTEPWLGGKKPNSFSSWLTYSQFGTGLLRSSSNYQGISITGAGVGLGRRKKVPDDFFNAYYEIGYQYYEVINYPSYFPSFSQGYANDISLKYILQRNSVDSPIYPKEGSHLTFTAKSSLPYFLMNGNKDFTNASQQDRYKYLEYFKIKFTGEWFLPLTRDKKLVLRPRIGFGFMSGYSATKGLTPFERFTLGGNGLSGMNQLGGREIIALRGYNDNSLSSKASDPVIAKYTLELRYPVSLNPQATFYVLAFAEAGNTFPTIKSFNPFNVKRSAGAGIRVFLPMFGMLGVDYGWGFDYLDPHAQGYRVAGGSDQSIQQKGYFGKLNFTIGMNLGEL